MTATGRELLELDGTLAPRLGYGTMRLTGPGVLGPPADMAEARRVLDRALELGVRVFDTAWYYGPDVPSRLLAEAVRASRADVVVATRLGWEYDATGRSVAGAGGAGLAAAAVSQHRPDPGDVHGAAPRGEHRGGTGAAP